MTIAASPSILVAVIVLACCRLADAQPTGKIARIGIVAPAKSPQLEALRQGLQDFGYSEGQNVLVEYRYVEAKRDRVPEVVAELLDLKIDLIVPMGPLGPVLPNSSKAYRLFSASAVIRSKPESLRASRALGGTRLV